MPEIKQYKNFSFVIDYKEHKGWMRFIAEREIVVIVRENIVQIRFHDD